MKKIISVVLIICTFALLFVGCGAKAKNYDLAIGVAVTDPLQLIANGLTTVETPKIYSFLAEYFAKEEVETIVQKPYSYGIAVGLAPGVDEGRELCQIAVVELQAI